MAHWRLPALLGAVAAIAALVPATAGAITVGSTFAPAPSTCLDGAVAFQTATPSNFYVVPNDGVITSWSFMAGSTPPSSLKLEIARETAPDKFFVLGNSAAKSPAPNVLNTYTDQRFAVQAGSVIGERAVGAGTGCGEFKAGNSVNYVDGADPKPGDFVEAKSTSGLLLDLSVKLNEPPTADAGPDQEVAPGATVTLDGSGSTDPDEEDTLSYHWGQTGGPAVTLTGAATATPSFPAPKSAGPVTFELEACDPNFQCGEATVSVTVKEEPPTANAGTDQEVEAGVTVALDGSGSTDPNGGGLLYEWTQTSGTTVSIAGSSAVKPRFTAVQSATPLTFQLKACDPVACATDSVAITVKPFAKQAPPAHRPPSTMLKSMKIAKRNVTFRFSSSGSGSTFRCKLDGKAFAKCRSPKTYKSLKPGRHKFQVKAVDSQGAADGSPAIRKFKIEG